MRELVDAFKRREVAIIRLFVTLHAAAFMLLPKDGLGVFDHRPEDVTAVLLLALVIVIAAVDGISLPNRLLTQVVILYLAYFLIALAQDFSHGHFEASVFWIKESSTIVFAYLVWRGFRDAPQTLITALVVLTLPNILFGVYQLLTTPRGIYGVAPLGHETSPASAGMIYFTCSIVMFLRCVTGGRVRRYGPFLFLSIVMMLAAGSKVAVLGALVFYGWYLIEVALQRRDAQSIRRIGGFAISAFAAIALTVSAASLGYSWRGLSRYRGLLRPWEILVGRGIWWKVGWIDTPFAVLFGAGYSPSHLLPDNTYAFGMSMDNQVLYYLVTGGVLALVVYAALMVVLFRAISPRLSSGRVLRALVVAYVFMGLGAEVLQLSVHGNAFWMFAGLCLAMYTSGDHEPARGAARAPSEGARVVLGPYPVLPAL